jgi:hypothetical protein
VTRLTDTQIAELTGRPAPQQEQPASRAAVASAKLKELDDRIAGHIEKERQPHESHAQAYSRVLNENPGLMSSYKAAKAGILTAHGVGDAASGGL